MPPAPRCDATRHPTGSRSDGPGPLVTDGGVPHPAVPEDRLTGWEKTEDTVETLFEVPGADVRGHTLVYEDAALRRAVRAATDGRLDRPWRFFFATRLAFRPPLPPGVGAAMVLPTVRREAEQAFLADLRERGFRHVERGTRESVRTASGSRAGLRAVSGRVTLDADDDDLPVEGWVAVWHDDAVHVAGGAYPATSLADALGIDEQSGDEPAEDRQSGADRTTLLRRSPADYRTELLDLVRRVGTE